MVCIILCMTSAANEEIFQVTDLARRGKDVVAAAKAGGARLRTAEGQSLVMLPESRVRLLEELGYWSRQQNRLADVLDTGRQPTLSELGDLGWLRSLDLEDIREFSRDLHTSLLAAWADDNTSVLDTCIREWRITAQQLADPVRREILTGRLSTSDFAPVDRP